MPILHDIASFLVRLFSAHNYTVFYVHSRSQVKQRAAEASSKNDSSRNSDLLAHFMSSREKYPEMMTDDQITTHCMVNVVAGIATSTTSITNALRHLVANQASQERLYQELLFANVSSPVTWRQTQALPYLEALVREGVRLRSPDSFNPNGRVVGPEGMELPNGIHLPPGTVVGIKPSVASIDTRTFGDRPYEFIPERWCKSDDETEDEFTERRAKMDRGDMSFSAGTRGCIGKGIALMQIYKLIGTLIYKYKVSCCPNGSLPAVD